MSNGNASPRGGRGLTAHFGVRMTPAERAAVTQLAEKKNVNDADLVREALYLIPGFGARVKRLEATEK